MTQSKNPPLSFIDNPHAPDVFADGVSGVFLLNGVLRLTFESARVDHSQSPGPVNRVVIGRLTMPLDAAKNLRDFLNDYLGRLEEDPAATTQGTPTIQ